MASKQRKPIDLGLDNYEELFMNEQERKENRLPRIYDIPLSEIDEFPDHPFQVRMRRTVWSNLQNMSWIGPKNS